MHDASDSMSHDVLQGHQKQATFHVVECQDSQCIMVHLARYVIASGSAVALYEQAA